MKQDLRGRIVVVTGASGRVGFGAAQAFLESGATIVLPTRDDERGERILADLGRTEGRVLVLPRNLASEEDATRLRDAVVSRFGRIDHVVVALGGWWQGGRVVDQNLIAWRHVIGPSLDAQFLTASALLPKIQAGGSYTIVTSTLGERTLPRTGLMTVASAGVHALARVLRAEAEGTGVRVDEVRVSCPVSRTPGPGMLAARRLGDAFVALAARGGEGALLRVDGEDDVAAIVAGPDVRRVTAGR